VSAIVGVVGTHVDVWRGKEIRLERRETGDIHYARIGKDAHWKEVYSRR